MPAMLPPVPMMLIRGFDLDISLVSTVHRRPKSQTSTMISSRNVGRMCNQDSVQIPESAYCVTTKE